MQPNVFVMKRILVLAFLFLFFQATLAQDVFKVIGGIVTDGLAPLENVNVTIKNTERGVKTDAHGKYTIKADEGEIVVYSHVGKKTVEIIVEDVTSFLNITMSDEVNELDEVVVSKRRRKSQKDLFKEYNTNKNLIKTAYGILDKERSGFWIKVVDGDNLSLGGMDFTYSLPGIMAGIRVVRSPYNSTDPVVFLPRRFMSFNNPRPVLYDLDGQLFTEAPLFLQTENIERIAILSAAGAVTRYGSLAAGGVIIINTRSGNFSPREPGTDQPFDLAKLRDNFYKGGSVAYEVPLPAYIALLEDTAEKEEAKKMYESQKAIYGHFPHYYLDAMTLFHEKFNDNTFFNHISAEVETRFATDPTILKALAFKHESVGNFELAKELYKKVFILRPHYSQSYMNLANSYKDVSNQEMAAMLFARYTYLTDQGFFKPSENFKSIMQKDFNNLLGSNGLPLSEQKRVIKTEEDDFKGTRLVFEWNDGEAEFELQFVNPNGQYYTWKHTLADNEERISEEKSSGFSCEEHLIYDPTGIWQINIKYLGNKSLTPTYLKVTTYFNFGTNAQRKEVKEFKLAAKNINQKLFDINNGVSLSLN